MTAAEVLAEFQSQFRSRKFSAALLLAFIDLLIELRAPSRNLGSLDDLLALFPQVTHQADGNPVATLILVTGQDLSGRTLTTSLRAHYDRSERLFREAHKRYDFPTSAPYGSGKWREYRTWWDALVRLDEDELAALRQATVDHVLSVLPSQAFDPASVLRDPPLFRMVLESFDLTARQGETTGAAYQGLVFGFLRADNPHLQVEIGNARTGGSRIGRIGDIDGWDGGRLAITAEVKQFAFGSDDVANIGGFASAANERGAIGIVAALEFLVGVKVQVAALGVRPVDRTDLLGIVELWDPAKQRTAASSMQYYLQRVEQKSALIRRFEQFLADVSGHSEREESE